MKWRYNYYSKAPQKNGTKKTKKKLICRVPPSTLGKEFKKNSLPSAKRRVARQRLTAGGRRHAGHLCRRPNFAECPALGKFFFADGQSLPSARHSAKENFCRRLKFAECPALGKGRFADGLSLPSAAGSGSRQRLLLPSARQKALGKAFCTRQISRVR